MNNLIATTQHQDNSAVGHESLQALLVSRNLISNDQLAIVLKEIETSRKSFSQTIVNMGFISEQTVNQILTKQNGAETIDLDTISLDHELVSFLPRYLAEHNQMIPISLEKGILQLAMVDIFDIKAIDIAKKYFSGAHVTPVLTNSSKLKSAIDKYYGYELTIQALLKEIENRPAVHDVDASWISPVVRLVENLLLHGIKLQASDIHFQPEENYVRIRYRINGILMQHCILHKAYWSAICVRLKVLSGLNLAESRKPQTGRLSMMYGMREVDFRVSSHPTVHGESIVLRILDKLHSIKPLDELGFTEEQIDILIQQIKQPQGLFILTGPTGSGKTTTLYSILQYLNSSTKNIMTLEQPIEYRLPMIRQSEIKENSHTTFADGVRSLLRQDPDIIFIGEIRDEDTAHMALRAAMTGHLVFTTLHTNDSISVLSRLRDLGLKPSVAAEYLIASVSQRLLRLTCTTCSGKGCSICHQTGFSERKAVAEVLVFNQTLKDLVATDAPISVLKKTAQENGFISMKNIADNLVNCGLTTRQEAEYHLGQND